MRISAISLPILLLTISIPLVQARTIRVPSDSSTIQCGIDGAADGDTVLVADGTYTGDGNRDIDFTGKEIVVMSENGPEATIIDSEGTLEDYHRGFDFHSGEDSASVLQGFTITNGWISQGGGIRCLSSSPTIRNSIIKENHADGNGGGMYIYRSDPTIIDCEFRRNNASDYLPPMWTGGAMYNYESSPRVVRCRFTGNLANGCGGMLNSSYSSPTVANCVFSRNRSSQGCGGMLNYLSSHVMVINCVFSENEGGQVGGMYNSESSPVITNCIFWGNLPSEIKNYYGSYPVVTYSNVRDGYAGEGNTDTDPLFRDPPVDDYHLMAVACGDSTDSPCIDTGHPDSLDTVLDCEHGLGTVRCDMGAYGGRGEPPVSVNGSIPPAVVPPSPVFDLSQNCPNPFNPSTTIAIDFRGASSERRHVEVVVFDIRGRRVKILIDSDLEPGRREIHWDGRSDRGEPVPSGIYLYILRSRGNQHTRKMVLSD